jgi:hypothetical protein
MTTLSLICTAKSDHAGTSHSNYACHRQRQPLARHGLFARVHRMSEPIACRFKNGLHALNAPSGRRREWTVGKPVFGLFPSRGHGFI